MTQLLGVGAAAAYAAVVTAVILLVLRATMGLRVNSDEEREGLDTVLHGETGYTLGNTTVHMGSEEPAADAPMATTAVAAEPKLSVS
jgi:hypothetical protein